MAANPNTKSINIPGLIGFETSHLSCTCGKPLGFVHRRDSYEDPYIEGNRIYKAPEWIGSNFLCDCLYPFFTHEDKAIMEKSFNEFWEPKQLVISSNSE